MEGMGDQPTSTRITTLGNGQERMSLMDQLATQLTDCGWESSDVYGVQMAIEEAVSNAFRHGNQNGARGDIEISYRATTDEFQMEVRDQGDGFAVDEVPDPTAPENLDKDCGRGLLLIRHYMNEVNFRDGGRTVVMRKRPGA